MLTDTKAVSQWFREKWYLLFICFVLILRVFFWFSPSHAEKIHWVYLWPGVVAAAALWIPARVKRLPKGFPWLAAIFLWLLLSCAVNGDPYLVYNRTFILYMFISLISFYLAIPTAAARERHSALRALVSLYCLLVLALALMGLYAALTGHPVRSMFSEEAIYVPNDRLYFFKYHPNEAASAFTIGFLLFLYLMLECKKALVKVLLALCAAILGVVIALTGSRTSMLIVAAGAGVCAFWTIYALPIRWPFWLRWPVGLAALCAVALLCYQGMAASIYGVASLNVKLNEPSGTVQREEAPAPSEAAGTPAAEPRPDPMEENNLVLMAQSRKELHDIGTLNLRVQIWEAGIDFLKAHPKALLFGVPDNVVSRIPAAIGRPESHLHNAYLEMLVLGGVPGLLMYLGYLWIVLRACWRMAFSKSSRLPYRFLGMIPLFIAVNGITEIYPLFSGNVMDMMSFALSGAVVALAKDMHQCQGSRLPANS